MTPTDKRGGGMLGHRRPPSSSVVRMGTPEVQQALLPMARFQLTVYTVIRRQITLPMYNIYVFFSCLHSTHIHAHMSQETMIDCSVNVIIKRI